MRKLISGIEAPQCVVFCYRDLSTLIPSSLSNWPKSQSTYNPTKGRVIHGQYQAGQAERTGRNPNRLVRIVELKVIRHDEYHLNFYKNENTHPLTTTNLAQELQVSKVRQPTQMTSRIPLESTSLLSLWGRPQTQGCKTRVCKGSPTMYTMPSHFTVLSPPAPETGPSFCRRGKLKLR